MTSADVTALMSTISADRALTWGSLSALTAHPDPALVHRLRDDDLLGDLRASVRWLDAQWQPAGLLVLGVLGRQARRGPGPTLELMRDVHVAARPGIIRLHAAIDAVHAGCVEEAAAWRAGDDAAAKALRVRQMAELTPDAPVRRHAAALQERKLPVYTHVADVVAAYLRLETGR